MMRGAVLLAGLALALLGASPALAQLTPEETATLEHALEIMNDEPSTAKKLIEPLAEKGDAEALNFLSVLLQQDGPDWEGDPERAKDLREAAIKAGSKAAAMNAAIAILLDSEADHDRAIELLKIAETEDKLKSIAAYAWGRAYLFGWGAPHDMKKGVALLEAFADNSDNPDVMRADAHFLLGRAYRNGRDVPVDDEKAFRHFKIAADLEEPRSQWHVGMMLIQGAGVAKNEAEAFGYVIRSAENGYYEGMNSAAVMFATGQGVNENDQAAREWYYEAAALGSAHALRGLGVMLVTGEGGEANTAMGVALLRLASDAGEVNAQKLLNMLPPNAANETDIETARTEWLKIHLLPDALT